VSGIYTFDIFLPIVSVFIVYVNTLYVPLFMRDNQFLTD
jgi:hypothetical protein